MKLFLPLSNICCRIVFIKKIIQFRCYLKTNVIKNSFHIIAVCLVFCSASVNAQVSIGDSWSQAMSSLDPWPTNNNSITLDQGFIIGYDFKYERAIGTPSRLSDKMIQLLAQDSVVQIQFYKSATNNKPFASYRGGYKFGKANGWGIFIMQLDIVPNSVLTRAGFWENGRFIEEKEGLELGNKAVAVFDPVKSFTLDSPLDYKVSISKLYYNRDKFNVDLTNSYGIETLVYWDSNTGLHWFLLRSLVNDFSMQPFVEFVTADPVLRQRYDDSKVVNYFNGVLNKAISESFEGLKEGGKLMDEFTMVKKHGYLYTIYCNSNLKSDDYFYQEHKVKSGYLDIEVCFRATKNSEWKSAGVWGLEVDGDCNTGTYYYTNSINGNGPSGHGAFYQGFNRPKFYSEESAINDIVAEARTVNPTSPPPEDSENELEYSTKVTSILKRISNGRRYGFNPNDSLAGAWFSNETNTLFLIPSTTDAELYSLPLDVENVFGIGGYDLFTKSHKLLKFSTTRIQYSDSYNQIDKIITSSNRDSIQFSDGKIWVRASTLLRD